MTSTTLACLANSAVRKATPPKEMDRQYISWVRTRTGAKLSRIARSAVFLACTIVLYCMSCR